MVWLLPFFHRDCDAGIRRTRDYEYTKGQRVISTLIFEDLSIVPLLTSIAFLTPETKHIEHQTNWTSIAIALGAVVGLVVAGKWLLNPIFQL